MRLISLIIFLIAVFINFTPKVFAHVLETDGSIGAVLHITPDDDPIVGSDNTAFLDFKDIKNLLDLNNCICIVKLSKEGQEIFNQSFGPISEDEKLAAVIPLDFPEKNIYKLTIEGVPKYNNDFSPFTLNFDIRVAREKDQGQAFAAQEKSFWEKYGIIIAFAIVAGAVLAGFFLKKNKKKLAVLILALVIVGHSIPIKAIHASHHGQVTAHEFSCCLTQAEDMPVIDSIREPHFSEPIFLGIKKPLEKPVIPYIISNKSPPLFS